MGGRARRPPIAGAFPRDGAEAVLIEAVVAARAAIGAAHEGVAVVAARLRAARRETRRHVVEDLAAAIAARSADAAARRLHPADDLLAGSAAARAGGLVAAEVTLLDPRGERAGAGFGAPCADEDRRAT